MSKTALAIVAALGAGTGAAVTAVMYNLRSTEKRVTRSQTTPPTVLSTAAPAVPVAGAKAAAAAAAVTAPVNPAGLFAYGFPGPVSDVATRAALISSYDRRTKNPAWVVEHITAESLASGTADRKNSVFREDDAVPDKFRAKLADYFRSGYDRGHQVPAADAKWSQQAMDETFYLTNMCPQVGEGFNRDYWAHVEDFCRRLTLTYPSVRVVTGPLYLPRRDPTDNKWYVRYEVIGNPPSVAVPTHFYKVIFAEGGVGGVSGAGGAGVTEDGTPSGPVALAAFVLPNAPIPNEKPLADFEVPIEAVERASGLEFASKLPPQLRRRLCAETKCDIIVKDYAERQRQIGSGSRSRSPSPAPIGK